jgi:hypothetical protein
MDERTISKRALERVVGEWEPSIDRLVDAVPDIMARADQIKEARSDRIVASIPLVRWAIPRLAMATAVLVLLAASLLIGQPARQNRAADAAGTLEALMLGQNGREFSADLILDSIVSPGGEK